MDAKEKAKELIDKFLPHTKQFDARFGWMDDKEAAKQCALISVDEILKAFDDFFMIPIKEIKYWQQVKEEINKL